MPARGLLQSLRQRDFQIINVLWYMRLVEFESGLFLEHGTPPHSLELWGSIPGNQDYFSGNNARCPSSKHQEDNEQ